MPNTVESYGTRDLIASDRVEGTVVYNPAGERLGTIQRFMVDKHSGRAHYAVMQFGGIMGIGGDCYPIPWEMLVYQPCQGGYVVELTKEQIGSAPHYHLAATPEYDREFNQRIYSHYGLTYD